MKKKLILSLACIIVCILFVSCSDNNKTISKDTNNRRIAVLSPELAEILCAIDLEDHIIAVTEQCDFPPILNKKTKIGSFSNPDIEKIVALSPDIIFMAGLEQGMLYNNLKKLGFSVQQFYPKRIEDLRQITRLIGDSFHREKQAKALIDSLDYCIAKTKSILDSPKVYIEIYDRPLMTVSAESFVGDILKKSGAKPLFENLPREYCRISAESVLEKNPDIIIITSPLVTAKDIAQRAGWEMTTAVQHGWVYDNSDIDPTVIVRAGPRSIEGIRILRKLYKDFYAK